MLTTELMLATTETAIPLTVVLSCVGAVTGVVGMTVSLKTYRRDRSQLELTWAHADVARQRSTVKLLVSNHGRRAASILDVGLTTRSRYWPARLRTFYRQMVKDEAWTRDWTALDRDADPIKVEPGETKAFVVNVPSTGELEGRYLRMYLRDTQGRHYWATGLLPPGFVPRDDPTDAHALAAADHGE
jgi:hypothetical protein